MVSTPADVDAILFVARTGCQWRYLPDRYPPWEAVTQTGVRNAMGFNYRRLPALALMQRMVADGTIGETRLWRATGSPTSSRIRRRSVTGALDGRRDRRGSARSETFVRGRSTADGGLRSVEIDDASSALLRFASGARGTVEMARVAVRRPCDFTVEVNGTRGTLVFNYARLNELLYGDAGDDPGLYGMRRIRAEHPTHPYAANWWPIGHGIGYGRASSNQVLDLLAAWPSGVWSPDFADGVAVQAICEAMEVSASQRRWVAVSEITVAP
jgi:predicted dehydrogenase